MPTQLDRMRTQIEARVEWDADVDSIREWMHDQDTIIKEQQLEEILYQALKRKAGTLTSGGIMRLGIGAVLVILSIILFSRNLPVLSNSLSAIPFILVVFAIMAMIVGVWMAFRGLDQLLDGISRTVEVHVPSGDDQEQGQAQVDQAEVEVETSDAIVNR